MYHRIAPVRKVVAENEEINPGKIAGFMVKRLGNGTVRVNNLIELDTDNPEYSEEVSYPYYMLEPIRITFVGSTDKRALLIYHKIIE